LREIELWKGERSPVEVNPSSLILGIGPYLREKHRHQKKIRFKPFHVELFINGKRIADFSGSDEWDGGVDNVVRITKVISGPQEDTLFRLYIEI